MSGMYTFSDAESTRAATRRLVESLGLSEDEVIPTLTSMTYDELSAACSAAGIGGSPSYGNSLFPAPLLNEDGTLNEYAAQRQWMIGTVYGDHSGLQRPRPPAGAGGPLPARHQRRGGHGAPDRAVRRQRPGAGPPLQAAYPGPPAGRGPVHQYHRLLGQRPPHLHHRLR